MVDMVDIRPRLQAFQDTRDIRRSELQYPRSLDRNQQQVLVPADTA